MGKMRVLLLVLAGVLGATLGGLGVALVVAPLALALAWELGRGYQARVMEAEAMRCGLRAFSEWAEHVLAETAEEPLDAEEEAERADLQRRYREAQRLLHELER